MSRSRAYVFTLNNWTPTDLDLLLTAPYTYLVYGKETGDTGTPHLQGYLYFKTVKTVKQVTVWLPRAFIEKRHGTHEQAREYCIKDGDVFEDGKPPKLGRQTVADKIELNKRLRDETLNDLVEEGVLSMYSVRSIKNARMDLQQEATPYTHTGTRGLWIYGPPGTGKSHFARTNYPSLYIKPQNKWFDGYAGEDAILLDDFDFAGLGHNLKIWADKWSCSGEVKGGKVNLIHKTFIVTSNYQIHELWPDDRQMCEAIQRRFEEKTFLIKHNP